jgi:chromate reductase
MNPRPTGHEAMPASNRQLPPGPGSAALRETLATMSARVIEESSVTVPMLGTGLDERGIEESAEIRGSICKALFSLRAAVVWAGG